MANMTDKELRNLIEFARIIIESMAFDAQNLDGGDIQDIAYGLDLITKTKYNPDIHGTSEICGPGDDWYEFAPFLEKVNDQA